jgi:hypothetical protein
MKASLGLLVLLRPMMAAANNYADANLICGGHQLDGLACVGYVFADPEEIVEVRVRAKDADASAPSNGPLCSGVDRSAWTKNPGGPGWQCAKSSDCAPACCSCSASDRYALVSLCQHGTCVDAGQACCALLGTITKSCASRATSH